MDFERILLLRHTVPAIEPGRCYGSTDVPLDERTFAAELPEIARLLPDDALIVSSPLARCRRLADALNTRRGRGEVLIDRALRERSYGDWEGTRWDDIARAQIDAWRDNFLDYAPPHGESVLALQTRVRNQSKNFPDADRRALALIDAFDTYKNPKAPALFYRFLLYLHCVQ